MKPTQQKAKTLFSLSLEFQILESHNQRRIDGGGWWRWVRREESFKTH
jgi:hypothetical protein